VSNKYAKTNFATILQQKNVQIKRWFRKQNTTVKFVSFSISLKCRNVGSILHRFLIQRNQNRILTKLYILKLYIHCLFTNIFQRGLKLQFQMKSVWANLKVISMYTNILALWYNIISSQYPILIVSCYCCFPPFISGNQRPNKEIMYFIFQKKEIMYFTSELNQTLKNITNANFVDI
jgi:hypothetical protein